MKNTYYYKEKTGVWAERYAVCEQILEELLSSEFWDVKSQGCSIEFYIIANLPESVSARVHMDFAKKKHSIFLSAQSWEEYPGFGPDEIKAKFRHELLHISTGWFDSDQRFLDEATRRGIELVGGIPSKAISPEMKQLIKRCYAN